MAGSSFGTVFRVTTFGESHGGALGAVVDGCPAGLALSEEDIRPYMERRRPGWHALSTKRKEEDAARILSGVFEGKTTGTPICILIENTNARSGDYEHLRGLYRPGHADYCFDQKYGIRDHRGGGRSSGRETAARVAAGAIAQKLLERLGIQCRARLSSVGEIDAGDEEAVLSLIQQCQKEGDSIGSTVSLSVTGLPAGLGDPVFEKLDANLAKAMFSIGGVKGLDIGEGRNASVMRGSENNDPFLKKDGRIGKATNHSGGILGGMSDGEALSLTVYFKPTPSISLPQRTVTSDGSEVELSIRGRHDPVIGARAAVVVEAMAALVLADALLLNMAAKIESLEAFYKKGGASKNKL